VPTNSQKIIGANDFRATSSGASNFRTASHNGCPATNECSSRFPVLQRPLRAYLRDCDPVHIQFVAVDVSSGCARSFSQVTYVAKDFIRRLIKKNA